MPFSIVRKNSCIIIIIIKILIPSVVLYIVSYNPVTVGALNTTSLAEQYGPENYHTVPSLVALPIKLYKIPEK